MRKITLADVLGVWTQAPSTEAAAQTLGISRRTLYNRVQSASPEELRQAITQIVAAYTAQLEAERQARMSERAAAQAQVKAVRKESVQDRTRLERRLAASDDALAKALRDLTIRDLREAGMERTSEPPRQEIDRLVRENQPLPEENAPLKGSRSARPQGRGKGDASPPVRRTKRMITLEEEDSSV